MRILFSSHAFAPSVGGIETVSEILAAKFVEAGHDLTLITQTTGEACDRPYPVVRHPSPRTLLRLLRKADVLFQNNIGLRSLLPALALRKRTVVVHQTWLRNTSGTPGWNGRLKQMLLPFVTNVAISNAIARELPLPVTVIGNPYRDDIFSEHPEIRRSKSLIFVGRLVSDKGAALLLDALNQLQGDSLRPDLTIVGSGPEETNLREMARAYELESRITFAGQKKSPEIARMLNEHRALVIPSRWAEPFGIVALEGIACGCAVIGSEEGGLRDAIGPCGITFPNGDVDALTKALRRALTDDAAMNEWRRAALPHLSHFRADTVAEAYVRILEKVG